ncbi:hypothetical protein MMC14_009346, partial [Varicellaria rhodocarpa]|nr:hypothetical protein [Varicellaria rhodocarpa]
FTTFAPAFTTFLLPWLALTAQLPYETSAWWDNFISLALAIGSPALITHSLTLTILNRTWIRQQFHTIRRDYGRIRGWKPPLREQIHGAHIVLQEAQQMPIRVSQTQGWLSNLIILEENIPWWNTVAKDLKNTRRGVTFSLVAQVVAAALAWVFTLIISFVGDLGSGTTGLQIATGSVWLWMIPVIWGWIVVGTQEGPDSIDKALNDGNKQTFRMNGDDLIEERQQGILAQSGLNSIQIAHRKRLSSLSKPYVRKSKSQRDTYLQERQTCDRAGSTSETVVLIEDTFDGYMDKEEIPTLLGFDIRGDEARQGPIYNHARVFTWSQSARTFIHGFKSTLEKVRDYQDCQGAYWDPRLRSERKLSGTTAELAAYTALPLNRPIDAYSEFHKVQPHVWWYIIVAGCVSMFVQWGTTGSAILIAYLTPTVGLGCRSGGLLLYGVIATIVWLLLVASALFSHRAMLIYQEIQSKCEDPGRFQSRLGYYQRSSHHTFICALAIGTRLFGKTLAIVNTVWIITADLFEYVGVYDTCWCQTISTTKGSKGWVVIFKSVQDLAKVTLSAWCAGIVLGVVVCLVALAFFLLSCRDDGNE